ncbi:MAG: hypothetical protein HYV07_24800 [Deltaproteobacteria bacterium]|nr:hypothetical protein [Deltaproteobacteria bacterium]
MHDFIAILTKPDNLPIAGMAVSVLLVLGVWLKQALRNDALIRERRRDEIGREMRR